MKLLLIYPQSALSVTSQRHLFYLQSINYAHYIDILFLNHPTQRQPKNLTHASSPHSFYWSLQERILFKCPILVTLPPLPPPQKKIKIKILSWRMERLLVTLAFLVWHELLRGKNSHFSDLNCSRLISMATSNIMKRLISSNTNFFMCKLHMHQVVLSPYLTLYHVFACEEEVSFKLQLIDNIQQH